MSFRLICKTVLILIPLCVTPFEVQRARLLAKDIDLKIWFGKKEYLVGEPIILHGSLKNNRDTTIHFWADDLSNLSLKEKGGKVYPKKMTVRAWTPGPTDSLKPGQTYEFDGDILFTYTLYEGLPVGTYSCFMALPRYLGRGIQSKTVKFVVREPIGFERDAQRLYTEAQKLSGSHGKSDEAFAGYQQLIEKYPSSVYLPAALYGAAVCYHYSDSREKRYESIGMYKKLIEGYPDFISLKSYYGSIDNIYENMKDKEGAIKTMNELIDKYPNTKISAEAKKRLAKIEKWKF